MSCVYRWVEHTGELELEIEAPCERAVFEDGLAAMRELLEEGPGQPTPPRAVSLRASDRPALLADWLSELAFLGESEGFVPEQASWFELDDAGLSALVEGHLGNPPHLVKAVTYHRLTFERAGSGWRASAVLDV